MNAPHHRIVRAVVAISLFTAAVAATISTSNLHAAQSDPAYDDATHASDDRAMSVEARFDLATQAIAEGQIQRATRMLEQLVDDAPTHQLADDALFTAARLHEERLHAPKRALALYQRLLSLYPDSRTARAASRRVTAMRASMTPEGGGSAALARFGEIVQNFNPERENEAIVAAESLLNEYPSWQGRSRLLLWLAQVHRRAGRHELALERYLQAAEQAEDTDNGFPAWHGAGDMAVLVGQFQLAESYYNKLSTFEDPEKYHIAQRALEDLAHSRSRARLFDIAIFVLIAVLVCLVASLRIACGGWWAGIRGLWPPPMEAVFMAPIAILLPVSSYTGHYALGPTVTIICSGGQYKRTQAII